MLESIYFNIFRLNNEADIIMWLTRFWSIIAGLILLSASGCANQYRTIQQPAGEETHEHHYRQTRSLGDQHYHAVMKYDAFTGTLEIEFLDEKEAPVELFGGDEIKAVLTDSSGKLHRFYFLNPRHKHTQNKATRVARYGLLHLPTEMLFARYDWLMDLSSFTLKVWIPIQKTIYELEFSYP